MGQIPRSTERISSYYYYYYYYYYYTPSWELIISMELLLTSQSSCGVVVYLSDFVPRMLVFPANLPYVIDTLCRYPYRDFFSAMKVDVILICYTVVICCLLASCVIVLIKVSI